MGGISWKWAVIDACDPLDTDMSSYARSHRLTPVNVTPVNETPPFATPLNSERTNKTPNTNPFVKANS